MLKAAVFFIGSFFLQAHITAQELEGEWRGYLNGSGGTEIRLYFSKLNDTTYVAESASLVNLFNVLKDTSICIMQGYRINGDTILLEEKRIIKPFRLLEKKDRPCLQFMEVVYSIKKKKPVLKGKWYSEDKACGTGKILLTKKL